MHEDIIRKIKEDFPSLSDEGVVLVREIFDRVVRLGFLINKTEPSPDKVKALVSQIVSFLHLSKMS